MSVQRFIYPSIWRCPELAELPPDAQLLFIGCFSTADDEGRRSADPALLKADIFPLRNDISPDSVRDLTRSCAEAGLIRVYGAGKYLDLPNWDRYQKPKYKKPSKIPEYAPDPPGTCPEPGPNPGQTRSMGLGLGLGLDRDGLGKKTSSSSCAELPVGDSAPPVFELTLSGGLEHYGIDQQTFDKWTNTYPGVDVMTELHKAEAWCDANPTRRKTKRGAKRFLNGWLSRSQDRSRGKGEPRPEMPQMDWDRLDREEREKNYGFNAKGQKIDADGNLLEVDA